MDQLSSLVPLAQGGVVTILGFTIWIIYRMTHDFASSQRECSTANKLIAESMAAHTEVMRSLRETIERRLSQLI